jgi:hypothetical protein
MTVNGLHSFLMDREDVIEATRNFLQSGALRTDGERQPIRRETLANQQSDPIGRVQLTQ